MSKATPKKATPKPVVIIPEDKVLADPTKDFFVKMLTRDIPLIDAIMDLIDNCIDGVHRSKKNEPKKPGGKFSYKGFFANIKISESEFIINDNCGGIPLNVAKHYAFKMGRSEDYHEDDDLETLGMYGIGMKRAIFKMGLKADVVSWHDHNFFSVHIPNNWTNQPDWFFDFKPLKKSNLNGILKETGTSVKITEIHNRIKDQFKDQAGFLKDLRITLKQHYGYIIQQGFKLTFNKMPIESIDLKILTDKDDKKGGIKPYIYSGKINGVDAIVQIGMYREFATDEEIEKELDGGLVSKSNVNAGVTVICNDRVVLYSDKTFLTGWGEIPVPKYHTQFVGIMGVVHFNSDVPIDLPVTTTKRGLDTSSPVYASAKNKIKEGLKIFTSFTNNWKTNNEERAQLFRTAKPVSALGTDSIKSKLPSLTKKIGDVSGKYQIPILPKPQKIEKSENASIFFTREKQKIDEIRKYYLSGKLKSASEVGAWCFDTMHSQIDK